VINTHSHAHQVLVSSYRRVYRRMRWLNALAERGLRPLRIARAGVQRVAEKVRGSMADSLPGTRPGFGPLGFGGMEMLEARAMLAADLSYATAGGLTDLTLTFDAASSRFQLVDTASPTTVVASALKADAATGGIQITGTSGPDILRLNVAKLASAGSTATITFGGVGDDTVSVSANADFTLNGSTLVVGGTTFVLAGFEAATLAGGGSANAFPFGAVTIPPVTIDGAGGTDHVDYWHSTAAVTLDLGLSTAQSGGFAAGDVLTSVENASGAYSYGSQLTGSSGASVQG
jgi:hypothetical protein